jgi:hypothetical protein
MSRNSGSDIEENEKAEIQQDLKDDKPEIDLIQDPKLQENHKNDEQKKKSLILDRKKSSDDQEITGILNQNVNIDLIKKFSLREIISSPQMFLQDKQDLKLIKNRSSPAESKNTFNFEPNPDPQIKASKSIKSSSSSSSKSKKQISRSSSSSNN